MKVERRHRRSRRGHVARWLAAGIAAALVAAALPAGAGATDYCVAPNTGCGGTNVATFQEALDKAAAATDADRILLGAATYTAPTASGFFYSRPDAPVEIVGSGRGGPSASIVTSPAGATDRVLLLQGGAGTSIHDLRIHLPQTASQLGGLMTNGTARELTVATGQGQTNSGYGVALQGGLLADSLVAVGTTGSGGVVFDEGGGTVRDSAVDADHGIVSSYGGLVERTLVTATGYGVIASRNQTTMRSSAIWVRGATGRGIAARVHPGSDTTVVTDGVNVVGPGGPSAVGVDAATDHAYAPASSASVTLTNSLLRGCATALRADAGSGPGSGAAQIAASYSDYDAGNNLASGGASITQGNISNVGDAGFVDVADGDYRLLPGSPLVDTGDPASGQGLDLVGNPLVTDGNLDGTARRDIGAYELPGPLPGAGGGQPPADGGQPPADGGQPPVGGGGPVADIQAPLVSRFRAAPSLFGVARAGTPRAAGLARGTRFRFRLSEPARVALKIQRALTGRRSRYRTVGALSRSAMSGPNVVRFSGRLGRRALRPGRYRVRITATDAAGNRSAPRTARFRIAGP
jgi:hypothetical protein